MIYPAAIGGGTADWDRAKARSLVGGVLDLRLFYFDR